MNQIKENITENNERNSISLKALSATKWSLLTEVFARLATPIANIVLARLLLPEAFGLVATITMVLSFAEIFTDAGFQKYIIQHEFESKSTFCDAVYVAFWSNVILAFFITFFIIIFRERIAHAVGNDNLGAPIAVASMTILLNSFSSVHIGVFRRQFEFKELFFVRLIVSVIPLVVTVPMAYVLRSFWALIIGNIVKSVVQALIILPKSKVRVKMFYSSEMFKRMFNFSFWTLVESITIWLTVNIDVFIIGRILDERYLGLYKTAIVTISNYVGIIAGAITTVLFSTLSRYQNDETKFRNAYFKFQRRLAIFIIPLGVGIFVFRNLVTRVLLGTNWMEISDFLGSYALLNVYVIETCYFASEVFRSKGEPRISVIYQCIMIMVQAPILLLSAKQGFEIMCISRIFIGIVYIFIALAFVSIRYGIRIIEVVKNLRIQTVSACIMGGMGVVLLRISDYFPNQFLWIVLCVILYFALLFTSKDMRSEILLYIKRER